MKNIFKNDFYYNVKLVEKYISIIQTITNKKRISSYKNLVFLMMKDIVKKNINNYLNLFHGINSNNILENDELIADCYIIFNRCIEKYKVGMGYNFYFYYNKSLSRNFFRYYQKELQKKNTENDLDISDSIFIINKSFQVPEVSGSINLLLDNLHFNSLEKRICESKLNGQRAVDFLKNNSDVTNFQYLKILRKIRTKLLKVKKNGEI